MGIANKPIIDLLWDASIKVGPGLSIDFGDIAPKSATQVFKLSPEVSLAAEKLIRSKGFKFPSFNDIHMPYEHTAIEYELTKDIRDLRARVVTGTHQLSHIGMHIRSLNDGLFYCTPYWRFEMGMVEPSIWSFVLGLPPTPGASIPVYISSGDMVWLTVTPSLGFINVLQKMGITPEQMGETARTPKGQQWIEEAVTEVPVLLFACGMLLTCKSGVAKVGIDAKICNKSGYGEKMKKRHSSSAYTVIYLSALENIEHDGTIKSHVGVSAHYVRGHFKQRKSGVYWWSSFVRGNGEPRKREAYVVKD